jgi:hypothetical protein
MTYLGFELDPVLTIGRDHTGEVEELTLGIVTRLIW